MSPALRLLYLVLAWAVLGLGADLWAPLAWCWQAAGIGILLALLWDAWQLRRLPALQVERQLPGVWPVDRWGQVKLTLHNLGARKLKLDLFDDCPSAWALEGLPHQSVIAPGHHTSVAYRLRPPVRGADAFGPAHVRVHGPCGLLMRAARMGPDSAVKVFPDYSALLGHSLQAAERSVPEAGAIRKRRRGEGTDFRQLRDFRQGDALRTVDWKASARQARLISRDYQEERDQQVVFLLDTGRRMMARDGVSSHFDHALQAVLTLGFIAQKQGDAVGLMSFGADSRWLAPRKGRSGLDRMLEGCYDLQPGDMAPDYTLAASNLMGVLRKRAFVVLISNLRDEDDGALRSACELLARRHVVLCASLRESALDQAVAAEVKDFKGALRHSAASLYLQQRSAAIDSLGLAANHIIDIAPQQLAMALVNRYRAIKESGLL